MKRWIPVACAVLALGLVGCGDDGGPTQPASNDVQGRVVDAVGEPVGGIAVIVSGKPAVTTAGDGSFTVPDVAATYDATVIFPFIATNVAMVYKDLTRRDPVLSYIFTVPGPKSARIRGTVPPAPGKRTILFFVSGDFSSSEVASPVTGDYDMTVEWVGTASSLTGVLHVLRWSAGADGLPDNYDGYASRNQTVSDAGLFTIDFTSGDLTDPTERTLTGNVVLPSGYGLALKEFGLEFGVPKVRFDSDGAVSPSFTFRVPDLPAMAFYVAARASMPTGTGPRNSIYMRTGLAAGASGVSLVLEGAPRPSLPVHMATGVSTATEFLWAQDVGSGLNIFVATPIWGANPLFAVLLAGNTTRIPDLSGQGMGLPAGAGYSWRVLRYLGVASTDAAATVSFNLSDGVKAGDWGRSSSESFDFTTAP